MNHHHVLVQEPKKCFSAGIRLKMFLLWKDSSGQALGSGGKTEQNQSKLLQMVGIGLQNISTKPAMTKVVQKWNSRYSTTFAMRKSGWLKGNQKWLKKGTNFNKSREASVKRKNRVFWQRNAQSTVDCFSPVLKPFLKMTIWECHTLTDNLNEVTGSPVKMLIYKAPGMVPAP